MAKQYKKWDTQWLGAISGLILPMLAFLLVWKIKYPESGLLAYFDNLRTLGIFLKVSSLCVATNLILFYPFLNTNRYFATRGVVLATLVYAVVIMFVVMI